MSKGLCVSEGDGWGGIQPVQAGSGQTGSGPAPRSPHATHSGSQVSAGKSPRSKMSCRGCGAAPLCSFLALLRLQGGLLGPKRDTGVKKERGREKRKKEGGKGERKKGREGRKRERKEKEREKKETKEGPQTLALDAASEDALKQHNNPGLEGTLEQETLYHLGYFSASNAEEKFPEKGRHLLDRAAMQRKAEIVLDL
ncbi:creB, partial [Ophiophagus hannah]